VGRAAVTADLIEQKNVANTLDDASLHFYCNITLPPGILAVPLDKASHLHATLFGSLNARPKSRGESRGGGARSATQALDKSWESAEPAGHRDGSPAEGRRV